ncbi:MAG: SDR family NAD(P)-dependent oxidoreductase [Deltaproteobacteria bacterium]|nr:SDR family NAD(P)-dependent oxidoreductase [Deltaproteobacteria bacterium]
MVKGPEKWSGRTVVITGGARGIGEATAAAFLSHGARVVLCDVDREVFETASRLGCQARLVDVRILSDVRATVLDIEETTGAIDVWVNNAGIMLLGGFLEQPDDQDRRQIEINLVGVLNGMKAVLPQMVARGRGHIVNVASMAGRIAVPYAATYSATKFAVVGLTEAVRLEFAPAGIDFSYVMPVPVKSELMSGAGTMRWPRPVEIADVAAAIVEGAAARQVEIYVPRHQRAPVVLSGLVPRRIYDLAAKASGLTKIFGSVDARARAAYSARVQGSKPLVG